MRVRVCPRSLWPHGPLSRLGAADHELCERFLRVVLVAELSVDVAGEVVGEVLADAELLQLAAHRDELLEDVLVKLLEVILQLLLTLRAGGRGR